MANDIYLETRAVEAERLAREAADPKVRAVHEGFAVAYRQRIGEPVTDDPDL